MPYRGTTPADDYIARLRNGQPVAYNFEGAPPQQGVQTPALSTQPVVDIPPNSLAGTSAQTASNNPANFMGNLQQGNPSLANYSTAENPFRFTYGDQIAYSQPSGGQSLAMGGNQPPTMLDTASKQPAPPPDTNTTPGWLERNAKGIEAAGTIAGIGTGLFDMYNSRNMYKQAKKHYKHQRDIQNTQMNWAKEDRERMLAASEANVANFTRGENR